jgi:hypothetical protein
MWFEFVSPVADVPSVRNSALLRLVKLFNTYVFTLYEHIANLLALMF